MAHIGQVQLAGRTVADPRMLSKDKDSTTHVVLRIAVNNGYRDSNGEWQEKETTFIDVNCWGTLADNVASSVLAKGTPVIVIGRLETRSWTGRDSEGKEVQRTGLSVYASHVGPDFNERGARVFKIDRTESESSASNSSDARVDNGQQVGESASDKHHAGLDDKLAMAGAGAADAPF